MVGLYSKTLRWGKWEADAKAIDRPHRIRPAKVKLAGSKLHKWVYNECNRFSGGACAMTLPTSVGKYQIEAELGRGGFATVYRAYDPVLRRRLAVKVPHPHLVSEPAVLARFTSEAQLAAGLNHRNIVTIYEIGEAGGLPYIAMELLDGVPLDKWLAQAHPPVDEALKLLVGVGAALDHAHQHGVIHRDVKPANILVVPGRGAVLGDFGIARALDAGTRSTSTLLGTPTCMAPEQVMGKPVTAATDIYALGVMLYEIVAGRPPFTGETSTAVMAQHATVAPPDPRSFQPGIPAPAAALLLRALAKEPGQRPPGAEALVQNLAAGMSGQPPARAAIPAAPARRVRPWAWLAGAAAVLLLVAGFMLLRGPGGGPGGDPSPAARPTASRAAPPTATLLPLTPEQALLGAGSNLYIEYILDASGSMLEMIGSRTKLAVAREVLAGHLRTQPSDANFGLRAYGHRVHYTETAKSCQDIELVAPVQPGQGERIAVWLAGMQAQGMSPIGLSLRQAAADFEMGTGRDNRIVLISDGKETCDIDPCREVAALQRQGLNIVIHVIGLNLDAEARTQLQCVARQSGGQYLDARTTKELRLALLQVSQPLVGPTPATGGGQATAEIEPTPAGRPSPTVSPTAGPPTATATPTVVAPTATRVRPPPTAGPALMPVQPAPSTGGGVAKPK